MFEKIEKLLDAGFTKDEILKMLPKEPEPAKDPEPEKPKPKQKTEEPAKNEKQDKPEPKPEEKKPEPEPFNTQPFTDAIKSMEEAMQAMNARMQKLALQMYEGPEDKKESVQDIIIKVIDPEGIKKGE